MTESIKKCAHQFDGGLCRLCLCPETAEDNQAAQRALADLAEFESRMSRTAAINLAWLRNRLRKSSEMNSATKEKTL